MDVTATTKYVRIAPMKARDLARAITGKPVGEALRMTAMNPRKAAFHIGKTLKSAIANAENNHELSADTLFVRHAVVDEGPSFRRFVPRARGVAGPIRRRSSHIRITLSDGK